VTPPAAGAAPVRAEAPLRARTAPAPLPLRARTAPAPLRLPPAPRRVSGPSRHPRATPARPVASPSVLIRLIDHPWLERLVRGRAWIAIVAAALLGIVAMQVVLLRLGAQVGNETSTVNSLIAQNETTQATIGALEASGRVARQASDLAMVYPAPSAVTYLTVNPGDAARAVHIIEPPSGAVLASIASAQRPSAPPVAPASPPSTTTASKTGATGATGVTSQSGTVTTTSGGATSGPNAPDSSTTTKFAPTTPLGK
jgi:hypothetical protein